MSVGDAVNKVRQLTEQWNDGLQLGVTNFCERYREYRLGVHVHFTCIPCGQRNGGNFCAVFDHLPTVPQIEGVPGAASEIDRHLISADATNRNDLMLVGIVELVKHPQGVLVYGATPLKRLGGLNDCFGSRRDALYHAGRTGFVFVSFDKNRELPASLGCFLRQDEDDMVEGGSQLMCNFTSEQTELERWLAQAHIDSEYTQRSRIYVWLQPHCISVTFKRSGIGCELLDVLSGPFNLSFDSI